jgi:peptidyl-prolyl cis-trans isomerase D
MAMIDKIRRRKELLIIFIGLGMVMFLVPFDAVMALFQQGNNAPIGEINGNSISIQRYQSEREVRSALFKYTDNQQLDNEVWNKLIEDELLGSEYSNIGLTVTDAEFEEITFGDHLSQYPTQLFYSTGATPDLKSNMRLQFEQWEEDGVVYYSGYKDAISSRRNREKWVDIVKKGVYANSVDSEYEHLLKEDKRTFDFVLKRFDEIPDSIVNFDEGDLRAYYRAHKSDDEYAQETERDIEFIEFKVDPSEADIQTIEDELIAIKADWQTTDLSDSAFCVANGLSGTFSQVDYRDGSFDGPENENFLYDPIGTYIGPYEHGNYRRVIKILDRVNETDSAEVRHILLNATTEDELVAAENRLDSIKTAIKRGSSFEDLVDRFSDDPGKVKNNGLYEWFGKKAMVPEFEQASFEGNIGDMPIVRTQYGVHLIEILGQKKAEITKLADISRGVRASAKTVKNGWNEANEFSINYSDADSFRNAVDTAGYTPKEANAIRLNAQNVGSLRDAYDIVRWSYKAEVGEVSQPIKNGSTWVVALLSAAREGGEPLLEDIRDDVETKVIEEKKAEMYIEIMGDPSLGSPSAIADAADTRVRKANATAFNALSIPGAGAGKEPEVLGLAFGIPVGEMSKPIRGTSGIYVLAPTGEIIPAQPKDNYLTEYSSVIKNFQDRASSLAATGFYGSIKEKADITDDRQDY